jgi:hypothetical protein
VPPIGCLITAPDGFLDDIQRIRLDLLDQDGLVEAPYLLFRRELPLLYYRICLKTICASELRSCLRTFRPETF